MCFDTDSQPPIARIAGAAVTHQDLELVAADGNRFAAFGALADREPGGAAAEGARPGIVILPDIRGLYHFYEELALRFAEAGIDAVAIDYFGRTAGVGKRADDFEFMPHVAETTWAGLRADAGAAASWLRAERGVGPLFSVGFCFGGRASFLMATAAELGLSGVIGFYGVLVGASRNGMAAPIDVVNQIGCPVLGLFGGADAGIPGDSIARFDEELARRGTAHELITYPDAPHSFFDRKQADFADESRDAWRRILAFVSDYAPRSINSP